jgi:membrane-associated PAP2 superfamily phosphatase
MKYTCWTEVVIVLLFLAVGTVLIACTVADLTVSSHFYQSGGWPIGECFPWKQLYHLDRYPALAVVIFGLCAAIYGFFKPQWRPWCRQEIFLVLLLALGPGLMVNAVFKDHWGRPRPREIIEFGGTKQFHQPWQPDINGMGRSFPCGHGSAAFYMTAPFYIYRRTKPAVARRWLAGGLAFGLLMSYARIAQGGHYLSDVFWAWGMVHLTALLLSALLLPHRGNMVYSSINGEMQEI